MFVVTEADAAAIRDVFHQEGGLSAAIELRRRFPVITDNAKARASPGLSPAGRRCRAGNATAFGQSVFEFLGTSPQTINAEGIRVASSGLRHVRFGMSIPAFAASRSSLPEKPIPSVCTTKLIASPCAPQPKQ